MVSNVEQCKAASDELVAASQYVEELVARKARVKKVETAFNRCKVLMETYYSKHATVLKALQPGEDEDKTVHEQRFKDTMEAYDAAEAKLKDYSQATTPKLARKLKAVFAPLLHRIKTEMEQHHITVVRKIRSRKTSTQR